MLEEMVTQAGARLMRPSGSPCKCCYEVCPSCPRRIVEQVLALIRTDKVVELGLRLLVEIRKGNEHRPLGPSIVQFRQSQELEAVKGVGGVRSDGFMRVFALEKGRARAFWRTHRMLCTFRTRQDRPFQACFTTWVRPSTPS